ncbi:MAG: hypothetical protein Q8934_08770 [Bacillota bacterium]|nr:hypothetical protein [Bacillota bacterium]
MVGFVSIYPNALGNVNMEYFNEPNRGAQPLYICSVDECSYLHTTAVPGALRTIKHLKRRIVLQHYLSQEPPLEIIP